MPTIYDITFFQEPDVFYVFLIDPPVRDIFSYSDLKPEHYDSIIGPIPIAEMDCTMPACIFKIKRWCLMQQKIVREKTKYNKKFVNGDMVVIRKGKKIQAGIYTDRFPLGSYESDLFPLLKKRKTDPCGFMYVDSTYLHPTIIKKATRKNA